MITLITGIPGSGKSYWAVHHVSKLKDQSKVLHNIEGFKLGISLDSYSLENNLNKTDIFRKSYHEKSNFFHGWVFIIDEASEYFPRNFKDYDIVGFFDYHRHYGIDIFLITQDIKKVSPDITCLAESHYRAASGASNPIPGFLLYQQIVGGESVSRKWLRKKKEVFNLYKSTNNHSCSTISIGKVYAIVAIVVAFIAFYSLKGWISSFRPEQSDNSTISNSQKSIEKSTSTKNSQSVTDYKKNNLPSHSSSAIAQALGGNPYPISSIRDYSGKYYIIAGKMIRSDLFPWKIVQSRTGPQALLPDAVYQEVLNYEKSLETRQTENSENNRPSSARVDGQATGSERGAGGSAGRIEPGRG